MMLTMAYTSGSVTNVTDSAMTVVSDPTVTVDSGPNLLLPMPLWWEWAYVMGSATITRARMDAPKFRPINRPQIKPIEAATAPSTRPQFMEAWRHPLQFNAVEPVRPLVSDTGTTVTDFAVITFTDHQSTIPPAGDMYTIRATTSYTPTSAAWTVGVLTFDDTLMAGQYSVIGLESAAATGLAARLAFPGPPLPGALAQARPGVIKSPAVTSQGTRYFRYGLRGEFGRFESFAPPQIDTLDITGVANPQVFLDIIQTRMGARAA